MANGDFGNQSCAKDGLTCHFGLASATHFEAIV
jgi:hypothetical protein